MAVIEALLIIAGFSAALYGLRWLVDIAWPPVVVRRGPDLQRRAARVARIDAARRRRDTDGASR